MTDGSIWVVSETDLLTAPQVRAMVTSCDEQVRLHLAPAYDLVPRSVRVGKRGMRVPAGDKVVYLRAVSAENTYGYHDETEGDVVFAVVGVGTVLDAGSAVLFGDLSVSTVLSHEICEMAVNPNVSQWSDSGKGWLVATEVCDPVQSLRYEIQGVSVSDFVLPDFFSPIVSKGDKFDHMGVLSSPFEIADGGYVLNYEAGQINTYFGAVPPPEWVMRMKQAPRARTQRLRTHRPG